MPPRSPWKKENATPRNANEVTSPAIDYDEVQADEVKALHSIFMEDFEHVEVQAAWKKTTERSFKLKIKPTTDLAKPEDFVTLTVKLTATYPKTVPILGVQGESRFQERTRKRILDIIQHRPKELLGEVMIFAIFGEIQEALDDGVIARQEGTLSCLDDERTAAEGVALGIAKEAEEAEERRLQAAQEERDRALKQMADQAAAKKRNRRPSFIPKEAVDFDALPIVPKAVAFDQAAELSVANVVKRFSGVTITEVLSTSGHRTTFLGKPNIPGQSVMHLPLVAVIQRKLEKPRKSIIDLEAVLEAAHKLKHDNLVNVFAYRIERVDDFKSTLLMCREFTDRGSLFDLLELSRLHINKARDLTVQILDGLEYLHANGMVHGCLSVRSICLTSKPSLVPKLADFGYAKVLNLQDQGFPPEWPSPEYDSDSKKAQRNNDIWDLGVVVAQMFLGLTITKEHDSPADMLSKLDLSEIFEDFLKQLFASDAKKRPTCLNLLPSEFLRTEAPTMQEDIAIQPHLGTRIPNLALTTPPRRRLRHNSANKNEPFSRYLTDFIEIGRLGKGGFGEVVKARNKLDGGVFAIKKIRQRPQLLDKVLSEVVLLNRLNHPYVVRYYNAWLEQDALGGLEEAVSATEESTTDGTGTLETETDGTESDGTEADESTIDLGVSSAGGLDFVSFSGIEFGEDDDDNDENEDDVDDDPFERGGTGSNGASTAHSEETSEAEVALKKPRADFQRPMSTLYIQMELCDRRTLRDLLHNGMDEEDAWRYMRQITEGLAHIHGNGIIHRDLKPDNVFIDTAGNPRIGDFGLATTAHYNGMDPSFGSHGPAVATSAAADMTKSVGTALYVAPELQSATGSAYNHKADMYSLGIVFFEMSHRFSTAMERIQEIMVIRLKDHRLPAAFHSGSEKAAQGKLIEWLISHKPSQRPTSAELLKSDLLPVKIEDETIRQALSGLRDPRSPYHQQLMSALFALDTADSQRVKALVWEKTSTAADDETRTRLRGIVRSSLETIFRRHGAEESRRDSIFPRSALYTAPNVLEVLDASGNHLQLSYDMILPHALQLARQPTSLRSTFTFGSAYRDTFTGGAPRVIEEADIDIVNAGPDEDTALNDAEIIKVMDEIVSELPVFSNTATVSFQLSHGTLLEAILDHCRVHLAQRHAVKESLSKLGHQGCTWDKLRPELRNFGLSDTTLDDLQLFNWRDTPLKAMKRVREILEKTDQHTKAKVEAAIQYLSQVLGFAEAFGIRSRVYISPLSCVKAKFYEGGMLFQCTLEKNKNSIVVAAGGRYDNLILAHKFSDAAARRQGAVGLCIGIDVIIGSMQNAANLNSKGGAFLKDQEKHTHLPRRCDVQIVANGTDKLRDVGIKLLASLWANDISAEICRNQASSQEIGYSFIVTLRHETSTTARVTSTISESGGSDVPITSLVSHIQQLMREHAPHKSKQPHLLRNPSSYESDRKNNNVQVLMASHGGKKTNKFGIVETAQRKWAEKLDQIKGAPILAIETRDEILNLIQNTRLGDGGESWKSAVQSVTLKERAYMQDVQDVLQSWKEKWVAGEGVREVCVYNFRTTTSIPYDLGI